MAYEFIKVDRDGPITTFTLNRPDVMNALHSPAHFELGEALDAFAADAGQWVGIREIEEKIWLVSFMHYDLGFFDHETGRVECADNQIGRASWRGTV